MKRAPIWTTGAVITYCQRADSEPELRDAGCVKISRRTEGTNWSTARCADAGGYVCAIDQTTRPTEPPVVPGVRYVIATKWLYFRFICFFSHLDSPDCEEGWKLKSDLQRCYRIPGHQATFFEAQNLCAQFGASLSMLTSQAMHGFATGAATKKLIEYT